VLQVAFPGRTVDVTTRVDDEATLATLENELPYTIGGLQEGDLFVFYYAGHGFYGEGGNRLTAYDSNAVNLEGTTWLLSLEASAAVSRHVRGRMCAQTGPPEKVARDSRSNGLT